MKIVIDLIISGLGLLLIYVAHERRVSGARP